ncbi:MAG: hypothetical protein LBJ73_01060 [Rickettsiales bacterium]|jgi:Sec-independent protein translocase protein TatA|nr:hypothetical protein [Rickettsiales bacterium]
MFGISWAELLVVLLVAVLVIPVKHWPDVARFVARCVKFVRDLIWKISDATENIKEQIDLEKPIDDLIKHTTEDVLANFSDALPKKAKPAVKKKTSSANLKSKARGAK